VKKDIQLVKDNILLRPYRPADAACTYEAAIESANEVGTWLPWCHPGYTLKESKDWIKSCGKKWKNGTAYEFGIFDSKTGDYIGGAGLNHIDSENKTANLGYWVRTSRTRQGVATAATALLLRFGFDDLHINRIEIVAAVGNKKSQSVAQRSGGTREGILRSRLLINGCPHDAVLFSFIPQDSIPDTSH
jgi:RimJ/RimL family protein N-acetyltransferase